jgi:hypothetical protein
MSKKKTNVATATNSTVAFSPQHVDLIKDRLGKIEGDIYLVANMAALIAPDSEVDIEMHTVLGPHGGYSAQRSQRPFRRPCTRARS